MKGVGKSMLLVVLSPVKNGMSDSECFKNTR